MRNLITILILLLVGTISNADTLSHSQIERLIVKAAKKNGVDPLLALSIADVESKLNPNAVGSLGEIGVFQLRPSFHSVVKGNERHNIDVATKYLAKLKVTCNSYGKAYFVCFNYGPVRHLNHPTLFPYYRKVSAALAIRKRTQYLAER